MPSYRWVEFIERCQEAEPGDINAVADPFFKAKATMLAVWLYWYRLEYPDGWPRPFLDFLERIDLALDLRDTALLPLPSEIPNIVGGGLLPRLEWISSIIRQLFLTQIDPEVSNQALNATIEWFLPGSLSREWKKLIGCMLSFRQPDTFFVPEPLEASIEDVIAISSTEFSRYISASSAEHADRVALEVGVHWANVFGVNENSEEYDSLMEAMMDRAAEVPLDEMQQRYL